MQPSSLRCWLLAARPFTLTAAVAPVVVGLAVAYSDIRLFNVYFEMEHLAPVGLRLVPAVLCLLFAIVMQVDANFINDYFDYRRGLDGDDRLGPPRACQSGWIKPETMKRAIVITTLLGCIIGLPLVFYGGVAMLVVGVACVVCSFLYTTVLSRRALGDVLVVVFFGLVPVMATYYLQTYGIMFGNHRYTGLAYRVFYLALAQGLVADCLLLVNNHRDRASDRRAQRLTLPLLLGPELTEALYMMLGVVAVVLCLPSQSLHHYTAWPLALFVLSHFLAWRRMMAIGQGRELNKVLTHTALNILLFALLLAIGVNL